MTTKPGKAGLRPTDKIKDICSIGDFFRWTLSSPELRMLIYFLATGIIDHIKISMYTKFVVSSSFNGDKVILE